MDILPLKAPLCGLLAAALLLPSPALGAESPEPPEVSARSAVLMDAGTGEVLYGKEEHLELPPASLTKLMTCLLAMEEGDPEEPVPVTAEALDLMPGSSTAGLREGEALPLREMLYALMLASGNDAANAIAIHLAGSTEAFARRMNERAEELGLSGSHFSNAHGLPARDHATTAYDLAVITREALSHPEFLDYAGSASHQVPAGAENGAHSYENHNWLLLPYSDWYDPEAIAGKTGWTVPAGSCLMTVARREERTLIAVLLRAGSDGEFDAAYLDTLALFDYGFALAAPEAEETPPGTAGEEGEGPPETEAPAPETEVTPAETAGEEGEKTPEAEETPAETTGEAGEEAPEAAPETEAPAVPPEEAPAPETEVTPAETAGEAGKEAPETAPETEAALAKTADEKAKFSPLWPAAALLAGLAAFSLRRRASRPHRLKR